MKIWTVRLCALWPDPPAVWLQQIFLAEQLLPMDLSKIVKAFHTSLLQVNLIRGRAQPARLGKWVNTPDWEERPSTPKISWKWSISSMSMSLKELVKCSDRARKKLWKAKMISKVKITLSQKKEYAWSRLMRTVTPLTTQKRNKKKSFLFLVI